jgi:polyvinyl alcohol dehydrogenase (cytochrome)
MQWGSAVDDKSAYFPVADAKLGADAGGLSAVDLTTGKLLWHARPPATNCETLDANCSPAQSAPVTVIPGVVFSGTLSGTMLAFSTEEGKLLWQYNTSREFTTVNGVPARGGTLNGAGPVVADGMLFVPSGYADLGRGIPGNVLLAFGVE